MNALLSQTTAPWSTTHPATAEDKVFMAPTWGPVHWGSAQAFRHFVGYIAASASADAFIPDYRLAPENVFPAAVNDVESCYDGLIERVFGRIAIVGDSAGGTLALVLLRLITERNERRPCHSGRCGGAFSR